MERSRKKKKSIFVLIAVIIILLVFFTRVVSSSPLENVILKITAPFTTLFSHIWGGISSGVTTVADMRGSGKEVVLLRDENQKLLGQVTGLREVERENEALRGQLHIEVPKTRALIDANVIAFDPLSFVHSVIINKGSRDGIKENMPVVMSGDIVFGKIAHVYTDTSEVMLISDSNNKVSAMTASSTMSGVLGGSNGGSLIFDLIEKKAELSLNELVITSGLDNIYPRGLIVGWISKIISQEESIFQQAYLRPAYAEKLPFVVFVISSQ